jgi:hypothetical protein
VVRRLANLFVRPLEPRLILLAGGLLCADSARRESREQRGDNGSGAHGRPPVAKYTQRDDDGATVSWHRLGDALSADKAERERD